MKMIRILMSLSILASLLLTGCGGTADQQRMERSYVVLQFGYSDAGSGARHESEYDAWSGTMYQDEDADRTVTTSVGGEVRTGEFLYANKLKPNNFVQYQYIDENGDTFSVDEAGKLVSCHWPVPEASAEQEKKTEEECFRSAKAFLSQLVDSDEYQSETEYDQDDGNYIFTFTKHLGGYATADQARITVSETGGLRSFSSRMLGRIPLDSPADFDSEKVTEAVYAKLDLLYADVKDEYERLEYELHPFYITVLDNGASALISEVSVDLFRRIEGTDHLFQIGEHVSFVILMD